MRGVFFNLDGHAPSGVVTFCRLMGAALPESLVVSLNMEEGEKWFENELLLPSRVSHRGDLVAEAVYERLVDTCDLSKEWLLFPNVGDVCYYAALELARQIGARSGISPRVVGICHSDDEGQYQVLERYSDMLSSVAVVSSRIGATLRDRIPGLSERMCRIDYPIDLGVWNGSLTLETRGVALELVYLGRLDCTQKRVDRLVGLAEALLERGVEFRLTIIGDGRDAALLKEDMARSLGENEGERVCFTGALDHADLVPALKDKDVSVLVSEFEGTPLAMLETMAAGLCPVVMNIESGVPEIIQSGRNGIIVEQGCIGSMADAIAGLARDDRKLSVMRSAARNTVVSRNSVDACWQTLLRFAEGFPPRERESTGIVPKSLHYEVIGSFANSMVESASTKRIGVFGGGLVGRQLVDSLLGVGLTVEAIFDSDLRKVGQCYVGIEFLDPKLLPSVGLDLILIGSFSFVGDIRERIHRSYEGSGMLVPEIVSIA